MLDQRYNVPQNASEILGDLTALAEQLGGTEGLGQLSLAVASLGASPVDSVTALEAFLDNYSGAVLIPDELPAVLRAYDHAARGQVRELIALDQELAQSKVLVSFAAASCQVGQTQLRRLRPLRGERVVQRYLKAVEQGEARAWHTIVYGLVLAVYSLPLRQGLIHFAHQTLHGFVQAASHRLGLKDADRERLLLAQTAPVAAAVEHVIAQRTPVAALES